MMEKTAIALGTFDGVHTGHLSVINAAVNSGFKPIAVAFPEPPKCIMSGEKNLLNTSSEKKEILLSLGISEIYYLDFNGIKDNSPIEFLEFLKEKFKPAVICCGFNYRFGKGGNGNTDLIDKFCGQNEIEFIKIEPVCSDKTVISSTYIRELLEKGEVEKANNYLREPFSFEAEIIHGARRGRTIGFPTINQIFPLYKAAVRFGVYETEVTVKNKTYKGITNIGIRPTFKTEAVMAETYIFDFSSDIYGQTAKIKLIKFIRSERKFDSVEQLRESIADDIRRAHQ